MQMFTASSAQKLTTTDALSYLKAVKEKFHDKKDKYNDFIDIMKGFKDQRIGTHAVISKVKELFKGDRELILGFNAFLPRGYEITFPQEVEPLQEKKPVKFEEAMSFINKVKYRFQGDDHVNKAFIDILNMYKADNKSIKEVYQKVSILLKDHNDLLVEFTHFLPNTAGAASIRCTQPVGNHTKWQDDSSSAIPHAVSVAVHACVDHPESEQLNLVEEEQEKREHKDKRLQDPMSSFCDKVKERLKDSEDYKKFLDCVRSYGNKFVTRPQFQMLVTNLLGLHPDLMEECKYIMTCIEKNGCFQNSKQSVRSVKVDDHDGEDNDTEDREENRDCENVESYRNNQCLAFNPKDTPGKTLSAIKEKFMTKHVQEIDISKCKKCTPSYRILPENYPIPTVSYRTEVGAKVLNDQLVSVTSGSEDYSFKHMRKNPHEESLFCCEDDRFELDMLLESVNTTIKRVEELLGRTNAHKTDIPCHIEDHLTALNLRCIERLYGEHGLDVMDVLRKNAPLALPIVLIRLKQKQAEWKRCRSEFNAVWADTYAQNYHKSLDHRSFYFKQQDTKNLSAKAMLAEIKDISEKHQDEEEMLLSLGAGHRQPNRPHMKFEYADTYIQEDLYQLVMYASEVVCTPEQHEKVMKIWASFVEPMLGVYSHPRVANAGNVINSNEKFASSGELKDNPLGEASLQSKSSKLLRTGGENIPADQACSSRVWGSSGSKICFKNDGSHSDYVSCSRRQSCLFERTPTVSGETCFLEKNGPDGANADHRTTLHPSEESQDDVSRKLALSSFGETKAQKCYKETESCSISAQEEGELSRYRNLKETNLAAFGNCVTRIVEASFSSAANARRNGGETCIQETCSKNYARAVNEGEKHAHGLSGRENTSESETTGLSPKDPYSDGDHYKNDIKTASEEKAIGVADGAPDREEMIAFSGQFLQTSKPLGLKTPIADKKNSKIFYGSDSFYLLFRLHQKLYERMQIAKLHSLSPDNKWRILNVENPADSYARFKNALRSLLNGSSDNAKFEDECRAIIGAQSYILFTLDKLILRLVKQIQIIASEEMDKKLLELNAYERSRTPGKFTDVVYLENARFISPEDNLYRIECAPSPAQLSIQLLKYDHDKPEATAVYMDSGFAAYLHRKLLAAVPEEKRRPTLFLNRNKRKVSVRDELSSTCKAMEGLLVYNGLEMKVSCSSMKPGYVMHTEDVLYRIRKKRRKSLRNNNSRTITSKFIQLFTKRQDV